MALLEFSDLNGFAVDLGGTKIAAAAIQAGLVGEIVVRKTDTSSGVEQMVHQLADLSKEVGFEVGQPIGVAVAGRLDSRGLWSAVNKTILKDLRELPLKNHLKNHLGSGVTTLNDTHAAAVGEYRFGAGRGASSMAYVTVSTGISAGFVLNGVPLTSPNGMLGHVGFMTCRRAIRTCGSGRFGTYESVASGRSIEARAYERGKGRLECESIFELAAAGVGWALDLVSESSAAVAELCGDLAAVLGIECVVLGGGVGLADIYIDLVRQHLDDEPEAFRPEIVPAKFGKNSALVGALAAALEHRGAI